MKKKQHTVADVLHYAADHCLAFDSREGGKYKFSCSAVTQALEELKWPMDLWAVMDGLKEMGCDISSSKLFIKYGDKPAIYPDLNPEVQGMRYFWLKWSALMAEEQCV